MSSLVEKILGYVLLVIGLVCIFYAALSMRDVYTGLSNPPGIFNTQNLKIRTTPRGSSEPVDMSIALDSDTRKAVNMFLYYLLMIFILVAGSKISSLGIQLIKNPKVSPKI